MRIVLIIMLLFATAPPAVAGPWPRAQGQTFLSFGTNFSTPKDTIGTDVQNSHSIYVEHGLRNDITLGFDGNGSAIDSFSAKTFLRFPVLRQSKTHLFSVQIGGGARTNAGVDEWMIHTGASWGRGFETPIGFGWATIDAQVNYLFAIDDTIAKSDITVGLKPMKRLKVMVQLQAGKYPGSDAYARLAPSIAWELKPGAHIEIGAQYGIYNEDRIGARFGTWLEF